MHYSSSQRLCRVGINLFFTDKETDTLGIFWVFLKIAGLVSGETQKQIKAAHSPDRGRERGRGESEEKILFICKKQTFDVIYVPKCFKKNGKINIKLHRWNQNRGFIKTPAVFVLYNDFFSSNSALLRLSS